jgi:nicotinamide mononucleotide (NMN) deamidase PncC
MSSRVHLLLSALQRLALPIVTAESCTSGLLASALTSRPTAPSILLGGITSYSNLFKARTLGVPEHILDTDAGGPGDVSPECAAAMARGVLEVSGLLKPEEERQFKFGVLLERGQGIGVSTTGFLDKVPEGTSEERTGEVYVGCHWVFKGKVGERVERLAVGDVEGKRDIEDKQDQQDANREARKRHVVERAIQVVSEIVAELEREETDGKTELDDSTDKDAKATWSGKEIQN